jgi:acyl-CoA thioester hydrolase
MLALKPFRFLRHHIAPHAEPRVEQQPDAPHISAWSHSVRSLEHLRLADTDLNGHITHPAVAALLQNARALLLADPNGRLAVRGVRWVTRSLTIDFLGETFWPGSVEIHTAIIRLGTSSLHVQQCLTQQGSDKAKGRAVMVLMDSATRRAMAIPPAIRQVLSEITESAPCP